MKNGGEYHKIFTVSLLFDNLNEKVDNERQY